MRACYSDVFVLSLPDSHRVPMRKYSRLRERIVEERILSLDDMQVPDAIDWDALRLAHDDAYIEAVARGTLAPELQRRIGFPWSPEMVERSRRSVGATLAAARHARGCRAGLSGPPDGDPEGVALRVAANLAGGTPHAFRDRGEGYCVFNDVAVAARVLLAERAIARAAVVDCDVHQGNGTAAIFRDDPAVFTLSFHGAKNFPFPDIVFYLAGADPYEGDRLGRLTITVEGLRERNRLVFDLCRRRGIPVAVAMSGGYAPDIEAIVTIHANTIREAVAAQGTLGVENASAVAR